MSTQYCIPQALIDSLEQDARKNGQNCWRIKFNGKYITVSSGKSSWKTKGHARSAFNNHLCSPDIQMFAEANNIPPDSVHYGRAYYNRSELRKIVIQALIDSGLLEFVEVKE